MSELRDPSDPLHKVSKQYYNALKLYDDVQKKNKLARFWPGHTKGDIKNLVAIAVDEYRFLLSQNAHADSFRANNHMLVEGIVRSMEIRKKENKALKAAFFGSAVLTAFALSSYLNAKNPDTNTSAPKQSHACDIQAPRVYIPPERQPNCP